MPATMLSPRTQPALVGRKRVGDDRARVCHEQRPAPPLQHAHERSATAPPCVPSNGVAARADREHGEDGGTRRCTIFTRPYMSPSRPKLTTSTGRDDHVAHHQPEQVARVAGGERVDPEAAEDVGQRDEQDRAVDGRDEHAERRVRQDDPLRVPPRATGANPPRCRRDGWRWGGLSWSLLAVVVLTVAESKLCTTHRPPPRTTSSPRVSAWRPPTPVGGERRRSFSPSSRTPPPIALTEST